MGRRNRRERPGPEGDVVGLDGKGPVERVADLYRYLKRPPSAAIAMFMGNVISEGIRLQPCGGNRFGSKDIMCCQNSTLGKGDGNSISRAECGESCAVL